MNPANVITVTRIVCAAALLFTRPFSPTFWLLYAYGGASDLADGLVARLMKRQTDLGATLDSVADAAFLFVIAVLVVPAMDMPIWLYLCAAIILCVRLAGYWIGYKKYRAFSALHTYLNKITGLLLFGSPVLYAVFGAIPTGALLCAVALFSAVEELLLTVRSGKLNRDRKSLFLREK